MPAPSNTINLIEDVLNAAFSPSHLDIVDESHLHAGHAGTQNGKGHYALTIHAPAFAGKQSLQRHRLIYAALGELMQTHIHALSIVAKP